MCSSRRPRRSAQRVVLCAGLLVLASGLLVGASAAQRQLTLAQVSELARARSPAVGVARADISIRETEKREVLSNWAPSGAVTYAITGVPAIQCRGPGNDANPATRRRDCVNTVDP